MPANKSNYLQQQNKMIKLGIIGNGKQADNVAEAVKKTGKFEIIDVYEPTAESWEDAYFSNGYDKFIKASDSLLFCEDSNWYSPLVEKGIYSFKHIFTDGLKLENSQRLREWSSLVYEAGVVFHAGNQLSVSPSFLSIWPYLKKCNWMELNVKMPFKDKDNFKAILSQTIELSLKSVKGSIEKFNKNESRLFGLDFPEHFSLWMESSGGTNIKINLSYTRHEKEIVGTFGTDDRLFEVDFLAQKVWELQKNTDNNSIGALFNSENELELQHLLPEIKKVPKQVIYFDSLGKELINFWDNITNNLSPLTGIHELVEVSILCEKIFPEAGKYQTC